MNDILCCARCRQPLKVVCDAHGTEWVPDRQTTLPPLRKDRPLKLRNLAPARPKAGAAQRVRATTLKSRILDALSNDPQQPSTAATLATALGDDTTPKNVGIYLCILAKRHLISRVSVGQYVRVS